MDNTDLTRGLPYGSEEAENLIAAELRKRSERGLEANRDEVEMDLLNSAQIAAFQEPKPVHQSERSRRIQEGIKQAQLTGGGADLEQKVRQLVDRGYSRDEAVARLANTGQVAW